MKVKVETHNFLENPKRYGGLIFLLPSIEFGFGGFFQHYSFLDLFSNIILFNKGGEMNNKEKAKEISNDEYAEILSYNIGHPLICDNCGAIIYDRDTTDAAFRAAIKMAQWKDEQVKQLLIEETKFLSPLVARDSVKRCTINEIYRELFNEEMPNSNPYIK